MSKSKNIYKKAVIALALGAALYQVFTTISVCSGKENIQMIYEVKPGENLNTVASKFDTTPQKLQQLNKLGAVIIVEPGTRLKID